MQLPKCTSSTHANYSPLSSPPVVQPLLVQLRHHRQVDFQMHLQIKPLHQKASSSYMVHIHAHTIMQISCQAYEVMLIVFTNTTLQECAQMMYMYMYSVCVCACTCTSSQFVLYMYLIKYRKNQNEVGGGGWERVGKYTRTDVHVHVHVYRAYPASVYAKPKPPSVPCPVYTNTHALIYSQLCTHTHTTHTHAHTHTHVHTVIQCNIYADIHLRICMHMYHRAVTQVSRTLKQLVLVEQCLK